MCVRQEVLRFVINLIWVSCRLWVALLFKYYFLMLFFSFGAIMLTSRATLKKSGARGFMVINQHCVKVVHDLVFIFLFFLRFSLGFNVSIRGHMIWRGWWEHRHYFFIVFFIILLKLKLFRLFLYFFSK